LAELDAVFFVLNLPTSTNIQAFTYGTPRVGNIAWAQLVDTKVRSSMQSNPSDILFSPHLIPLHRCLTSNASTTKKILSQLCRAGPWDFIILLVRYISPPPKMQCYVQVSVFYSTVDAWIL